MLNLNSAVQEIKTNGYTLLKDIFSKDECEHLKSLLEADAEKYSPHYAGAQKGTAHGLQDKSGEKVVFNLHNKHRDYMKVFSQPDVLATVGAMLQDGSYKNSEAFHLLNISARSPLKGNKGQQIHLDSNLPGGEYPIIMIALFMLDTFTAENGATIVIPGSHRRTGYAEDGVKNKDEVVVEGSPGSVIIYNGSLWHGGGPKSIDGTRWAIVLGYGRWFIKPSFDFMQNTPREVYERMSDAEKELFGFRSNPPKDEFTRVRRRSESFDVPAEYQLPKV